MFFIFFLNFFWPVMLGVMHKLSVPLEELFMGSTKKLALNRHIADGQGRVTKKKVRV